MVDCSQCGGTGYRSVERDGYTYAERCDHGESKRLPEPIARSLSRVVDSLFSPAELQIRELILARRGKQNALPIRDILKGLDQRWSDRDVKAVVEKLRMLNKLPIVASKSPPYGYFIPATAEEIDEAYDRYVTEGIALFKIAKLVKPSGDLARELHGQGVLEMHEAGGR